MKFIHAFFGLLLCSCSAGPIAGTASSLARKISEADAVALQSIPSDYAYLARGDHIQWFKRNQAGEFRFPALSETTLMRQSGENLLIYDGLDPQSLSILRGETLVSRFALALTGPVAFFEPSGKDLIFGMFQGHNVFILNKQTTEGELVTQTTIPCAPFPQFAGNRGLFPFRRNGRLWLFCAKDMKLYEIDETELVLLKDRALPLPKVYYKTDPALLSRLIRASVSGQSGQLKKLYDNHRGALLKTDIRTVFEYRNQTIIILERLVLQEYPDHPGDSPTASINASIAYDFLALNEGDWSLKACGEFAGRRRLLGKLADQLIWLNPKNESPEGPHLKATPLNKTIGEFSFPGGRLSPPKTGAEMVFPRSRSLSGFVLRGRHGKGPEKSDP